MSDIVERLRKWEDRRGHPTCGEMLDEAAAEIARLRLTDAEREAIEWAVATTAERYDDPIGPINRERLRGLLERTKENDT